MLTLKYIIYRLIWNITQFVCTFLEPQKLWQLIPVYNSVTDIFGGFT